MAVAKKIAMTAATASSTTTTADHRIQADRDEQGQPDHDQDGLGAEEQLHQAKGDRNAERTAHPDPEWRAPVDLPARLAHAGLRLFGHLVGGLDRLLDPALG